MSVRVIYIAGVPASGKSSLFRQVRQALFEGAAEFREGKVRGIVSPDGSYRMLGVFDGSTFEGTDKLSMTVIGDAIDHIRRLDADGGRHVVFVEGDRLFNYRFLTETRATLILLDADERVLRNRHLLRGDTQTGTFLKSRRTKVENFVNKYHVPRVWNNTPADQRRILAYIIKSARDYVHGDPL